jgi:deoxyribose-phosphate aldolase
MNTQLSVNDVTYEQVAKTIDHSLLRPELTLDEIDAGCELAAKYRVASVCCRPADVTRAAGRLAGSDVAVGTVVGFPHGSSHTKTKAFEARQAIADGATELDMVINIGWLRSGEDQMVEDEIRQIVDVAQGHALVKVILENAYLNDLEKERGSKLVEVAGADFVKTSTGFAPSGATHDDLRLMRGAVSDRVQVKAAGGVRDLDALLAVMSIGVTRIGSTRTDEMLEDYKRRRGL